MNDDCWAHVADIWQHSSFNLKVTTNAETFIKDYNHKCFKVTKMLKNLLSTKIQKLSDKIGQVELATIDPSVTEEEFSSIQRDCLLKLVNGYCAAMGRDSNFLMEGLFRDWTTGNKHEPDIIYHVALVNGVPKGFRRHNYNAHPVINEPVVFADQDFRGSGLNDVIGLRFLDYAQEEGFEHIRIYHANESAVKFWKRLQDEFKTIGIDNPRVGILKDNLPTDDSLVYKHPYRVVVNFEG